MKNLFIALVFMLVGSVAFASDKADPLDEPIAAEQVLAPEETALEGTLECGFLLS